LKTAVPTALGTLWVRVRKWLTRNLSSPIPTTSPTAMEITADQGTQRRTTTSSSTTAVMATITPPRSWVAIA